MQVYICIVLKAQDVNRVSTMKKHANKLICSVGGILLAGVVHPQDAPNVIVIYADDQGVLDLGCYGTPDIKTPNIDYLAEKGTRFTQFYAAPVSSASRASLLTGQFCKRAGEAANSGLYGLPVEKETLAQRLKTTGYNTALIGKWHLGTHETITPTRRGFDYFWGFLGGCVDSYSHFYYWGGANQHDLWKNETEIYRPGAFFVEENVKEIKGFIDQNDDAPFFVYWAANIPHYPYQPTEKWINYYKAHFPKMPLNRQMYAAFVSTLDESVGELLTYLKAKGLDKNTVIIYQADNGYSTEDRAFGGGGYNGPYRGCKFSLFDGGIRVPSIISWPGVLPEGQVLDQITMNIDWFPTLVELTGSSKEGMDVDGKNLLPLIRNKNLPSPHEVLYFDFLDQWAVKKGAWKLIGNPVETKEGNYRENLEEKYFLSNVVTDPSEQINYYQQKPEIVKELMSLREQYVKSIPPKKK